MKSPNSEQQDIQREFNDLYGTQGTLHELLRKPSKYSTGALFSFIERAALLDEKQLITMLSSIDWSSSAPVHQNQTAKAPTQIPFTARTEDFKLITFLTKTHAYCRNTKNQATILQLIRARKKDILDAVSQSSVYSQEKMEAEQQLQKDDEKRIAEQKKTLCNTISKLKMSQIKHQSLAKAQSETQEALLKKLKIAQSNFTQQEASFAGLNVALKSAPPRTYQETYSITKGATVVKETIKSIKDAMTAQEKILDALEDEIQQIELKLEKTKIESNASETLLEITSKLADHDHLAKQNLKTALAIGGLIAIYQKYPSTPVSSFATDRQISHFSKLCDALEKNGTDINDFSNLLSQMPHGEYSDFFNHRLSLDRYLTNFSVKSSLSHEVNLIDIVRLSNDQIKIIQSFTEQVLNILALGVSFNALCHHLPFASLNSILNKNDEIEFLLDQKKNKSKTFHKIISEINIPPHYLLLLKSSELFHLFKYVGTHTMQTLKAHATEKKLPVYAYLLQDIMRKDAFEAMAEEIKTNLSSQKAERQKPGLQSDAQNNMSANELSAHKKNDQHTHEVSHKNGAGRLTNGKEQPNEEHEQSDQTTQSSSRRDSEAEQPSLAHEDHILSQESIESGRRFTFFPNHLSLRRQEPPNADSTQHKAPGKFKK